ncbi:MAG: NTP transferase domain-containing protein [bacterium]|nr:NTP transferase domain-containing protein [bacterium]
MKLFILAAGKGDRLWPLTRNTPKSLLDFGDGTTILERQLENALQSGLFSEINIVTGYKSEQIEAKLKDLKASIPICTIFNPLFEITNNLISLWTAHLAMLDQDFMVTNGDNIYIADVFRKVQTDRTEAIQLTIDFKDEYDEDDMKVRFGRGRSVGRVHKDITGEEINAESVGLALIKGKNNRRLFVNKIIELVRNKEYLQKFWLEVFNALAEDGVTVDVAEIGPDEWQEVDFHPDVDVMKKIVFEDGSRD